MTVTSTVSLGWVAGTGDRDATVWRPVRATVPWPVLLAVLLWSTGVGLLAVYTSAIYWGLAALVPLITALTLLEVLKRRVETAVAAGQPLARGTRDRAAYQVLSLGAVMVFLLLCLAVWSQWSFEALVLSSSLTSHLERYIHFAELHSGPMLVLMLTLAVSLSAAMCGVTLCARRSVRRAMPLDCQQ